MGLGAVLALRNELQDNEDIAAEAGKKISANISETHLVYGCTRVNLSQLDDANVLQFNNSYWA